MKTNPAHWAYIAIVLGAVLIIGALTSKDNPARQPVAESTPAPLPSAKSTPTPEPTPKPGIPAERFKAASVFLKKKGFTVEPQNPEYPMIMNITAPSDMAMSATDREAKELALVIRKSLSDDAIVTIKSPGGQTLATASLYGAD